MGKKLDSDQMKWVTGLNAKIVRQQENDKIDAQKRQILEKFAEQRELSMDGIIDGMKIQLGRPDEKKGGKLEKEKLDMYRKDGDSLKSGDVRDDQLGYRVLSKGGKKVEGELTDEWAEGQELVELPEFGKFSKARHRMIEMTDEAFTTKIETDKLDKHGNKIKKPLFNEDELTKEIFDPLVRRGVPETLIGNDFSHTHKMLEGSFEEYGKRLEKEQLKSFCDENKDLGIALFRMVVSLPGNIMQADAVTKLTAGQVETTKPDPVHVFQQNYGVIKNDDGSIADNLAKAAQSWAFVQNLSDLGFDGVLEGRNKKNELTAMKQELKGGVGEEEEHEKEKDEDEDAEPLDHKKFAPLVTVSALTAFSMNVGKGLSGLGAAGSTIFSGLVQRGTINALLATEDLKEKQIEDALKLIGDGIDETLKKLHPGKDVGTAEINKALVAARSELDKLKKKEVVEFLKKGELPKAVKEFNTVANAVGKAMEKELALFVKANAGAMKQKAAEYVTESLKEDQDKSLKPETDEKHKKEHKHDPDWVNSNGKPVCLRCSADMKDVNLFAGILDQKIKDLRQQEAYFKMAVNLGGMTFDIAANFLAPLAMGGALLRMSKFIFEAVKRWIDFHNFCKSKAAMLNAASSYSPAVRQFRENSRNQGIHYSINAACEGVKFVGAALQCTPAAIGGVVAAQAASGTEAVEAVLYELNKRYQLEHAWTTYKTALNNPENRRLGLVAIRENPTLAKYSVAWGAVVENDPLVGDFMEYCNLNSDTIKGNANIDKVVTYLEARMPDDIEVTGRRYAKGDTNWAASVKVALTAEAWIDAKSRGETQGNVKEVDTAAIESALTTFEQAKEKIAAATGLARKAREARTSTAYNALKKVKGPLLAYMPRDAQGVSDDMKEIQEQFVKQLELELKALKVELRKIQHESVLPSQQVQKNKRVAIPKMIPKVDTASVGGSDK
jgi:tetratricopeptide (TPR) repeat protein